MRSFILCVMAGFCFSYAVLAGIAKESDNCTCMRNYTGFTVVSMFDGVEFYYIASGETKEEASKAALLLFPVNIYSRFGELLLLPFSIAVSDVWHVELDINPETGDVNSNISTSEDGYSAWIPRCVCGEEQQAPRLIYPEEKKGRVLNIRFLR